MGSVLVTEIGSIALFLASELSYIKLKKSLQEVSTAFFVHINGVVSVVLRLF